MALDVDDYLDRRLGGLARTELVSPFVLYYGSWDGSAFCCARATGGSFTVSAVRQVVRRQQELGASSTIVWLERSAPGLGLAVERVGLPFSRFPLLALEGRTRKPARFDGTARLVTAGDPQLAWACSLIARASLKGPAQPVLAPLPQPARVRARSLVVAGAFDRAGRLVAAVGHSRLGSSTQLTAIGSWDRGRAPGAEQAVAAAVSADAVSARLKPFLVAGSVHLRQVFDAIGYTLIGTCCVAITTSL